MNSNFSLKFLENLCIHSNMYLNEDIDTYSLYVDNIKLTKNDKKILKNISHPYYGMIFEDYNKSRIKNDESRGAIELFVDSKIAEDFYNKCIEKNYKVIKYKISNTIEYETNISEKVIPIKWKINENNQKISYAHIFVDNDNPSINLIKRMFIEYYSLYNREVYTNSHIFYCIKIIDYKEKSNDFLNRFYDFIIEIYGKPTVRNINNNISNYYMSIYNSVIRELYEDEDDSDDDEEEYHICPSCINQNRDTDNENEYDEYVNSDNSDTDIE